MRERESVGRRCYLTFGAESHGTLFVHWSAEPVEGALAFFAPRKNVPGFKFKQNGGRSELIREMSGGTGERIKRYYSGICQFIKLAKSFDASLVLHASEVLPKCDVSLLDGAKPEDNVIAVATDAPVDSLLTICAVGCVPHQNPCLTATTMNKGLFVSTGHREGAALEI